MSPANAGIDVVLIDQTLEAAEKGKAYSHKLMTRPDHEGPRQDRRSRRAARPHRAERRLRGPQGLRPRRRGGVRGSEGQGRGDRQGRGRHPGRLRSSAPTPRRCRSAASPRHTKRRDQFIGIHFFSPVEKMMLVEIIIGKETGDKALATALDYRRAPSGRRRSSSTTAAASSPIAASRTTSSKAISCSPRACRRR